MSSPSGILRKTVRLEHLAYHDELTGLANRARLDEALATALTHLPAGAAVGLLSIDLDDFKPVNDGLGHAAGDDVLRQVAMRLETVRRDDDVLARYGGDEFALLISVRDAARAHGIIEDVARRIGEVLDPPFQVADAEFHVGASIGASLCPLDADGASALQRHADAAMYEAKESGGGFAAFSSDTANPLARMAMAARMRRGLQAGAFSLAYQPIYRLEDRRIVGVEALLRWQDGDRGPVEPGEFVPVAERTGVIHALGAWALETLCDQALAWDTLGLHPNFGINVSPRQLLRAGFADEFTRTVRAHGLSPSRFIIELTESAWTVGEARTSPALEQLAAAGFVLALDDFGAGYSSLSRLRTLPVGVIKVDRTFMTDLPADPQAVAVVDAILALANACRCDVVIEGVETEAQIAFLTGRSCRLVQGFGLSHPRAPGDVTVLLGEQLAAERRD